MALETIGDSRNESIQFATTMPTRRDSIVAAIVVIVVSSVFVFAIASPYIGSSDVPVPQGVKYGRMMGCWNKATSYRGDKAILWDFESGKCFEAKPPVYIDFSKRKSRVIVR